MLFTFIVCSLLFLTECAIVPDIKLTSKDKVLVKLDPNQVVSAFESVVSSDFLKKLSHNLAIEAAKQFLASVNDKQQHESTNITFENPKEQPLEERIPIPSNTEAMKAEVVQEIERMCRPDQCSAYLIQRMPPSDHIISPELNIDENQAMRLISDPFPDGDNLDVISPDLSEDEEAKKTKPPEIRLMKVNGKFVRRLLRRLL